jgi:ribosome maturation factor RimP
MDSQLITERLREIAGQAAAATSVELVNVSVTGNSRELVVRIYIDKEGGVTLGDCSEVSRKVEEVLDVEDLIPSKYVLEVSSPGIERELYSLVDFVKFTGRLTKLKMKQGYEGQKTLVGTITSVDGSTITVDDRTIGTVSVDHSDIAKANLKIDLSEEFKKPARKKQPL